MDISTYIQHLDRNTAGILQIVKSCSSSQLTMKKDDKWSIIEILEYICVTDKVIYSIISRSSDNINQTNEIVGEENLIQILD